MNILFNESLSKKDIDVYRMSLYPDKDGKRGTDEMIDKIGEKLRKGGANKISYKRRKDDGVDVEFSVGAVNYKAVFNTQELVKNLKNWGYSETQRLHKKVEYGGYM